MADAPDTVRRTRKEQRDKTTDAIIRSAFRLFSENGFKNTTIKQISDDSNVQVGSIYNIFVDKEDIAGTMMTWCYVRLCEYVREHIGKTMDLVEMISFPLAFELKVAKSDKNLAEIIWMAYASERSMKKLVDMQTDNVMESYERLGIHLDIEDVRIRMYAVNGAIGGLILRQCHDNNADFESELKVGLEVICSTFHIPCFDMNRLIEETMKLIYMAPPLTMLIGCDL